MDPSGMLYHLMEPTWAAEPEMSSELPHSELMHWQSTVQILQSKVLVSNIGVAKTLSEPFKAFFAYKDSRRCTQHLKAAS